MRTIFDSCRQLLSLLLCLCLSPALASSVTRSIKIVVIRGEGAFNDVRNRRAINPEVEIRDQDERPVAGIEVTFTLPFSSAGGSFAAGERVFRTRSNAQGRATTEGMVPNAVEGRFTIVVEAKSEDAAARSLIHQSNTSAVETGNTRGRKWLILSGLASAGLTVGLLAARGSGGSSSSTPAPLPVSTTVSIGSISVGGPR